MALLYLSHEYFKRLKIPSLIRYSVSCVVFFKEESYQSSKSEITSVFQDIDLKFCLKMFIFSSTHINHHF